MDNKSKRDNSDDTNKQENVPSSSQFKAMFKELLDEAKGDILLQVKENIDQIYADFESVAIDDEESSSCTMASDPGITDKLANFVQLPEQSIAAAAGPSDDGSFQNLAAEFSVAEQFSPAIVNSLLKDKLPKEKPAEVQAKYTRPENCPNLVSPKVNKQIWQQEILTLLYRRLKAFWFQVFVLSWKCVTLLLRIRNANWLMQLYCCWQQIGKLI